MFFKLILLVQWSNNTLSSMQLKPFKAQQRLHSLFLPSLCISLTHFSLSSWLAIAIH